MVDFRVTEQKQIEIYKSRLEIRDLRLKPTALNLSPSVLTWAEGSEKKGKNRYKLHLADEFAIWTTPPSPTELREALEMVKPRIIYLYALNPVQENAEEFLSHLAGLTKFAIRKRSGKIKISELAAITAQREATIKLGLEWLAASGHIVIVSNEDEYRLVSGDSKANPYLQRELFIAVKGYLDETSAYRSHFTHADTESIFT